MGGGRREFKKGGGRGKVGERRWERSTEKRNKKRGECRKGEGTRREGRGGKERGLKGR